MFGGTADRARRTVDQLAGQLGRISVETPGEEVVLGTGNLGQPRAGVFLCEAGFDQPTVKSDGTFRGRACDVEPGNTLPCRGGAGCRDAGGGECLGELVEFTRERRDEGGCFVDRGEPGVVVLLVATHGCGEFGKGRLVIEHVLQTAETAGEILDEASNRGSIGRA